MSAGLLALRSHSSHRAVSGASTEPFGGRLPLSNAVTAALVRLEWGGSRGCRIDVDDLIERANHVVQLGQMGIAAVFLEDNCGRVFFSFTTDGASS